MSEQILEQLAEEIKDIKSSLGNMATKEDLASVATKEDLNNMVTKEDLASMASKSDLNHMATKDDLASMASKSDLDHMATKDNLVPIKDDLDELKRTVNRNYEQIALNSETLDALVQSNHRHEKIIETLSLRSNEHESDIRILKQR